MINWARLEPGTICGVTNTFNAVSALARIVEEAEEENSFVQGLKAIANEYIATHVVIITREHGIVRCCQMKYPKIEITDFDAIGENRFFNHLVFAATPPCLKYDYDLQDESIEWCKARVEEGIKYSLLNYAAFLNKNLFETTNMICSQLTTAYLMWLRDRSKSFVLPASWEKDGRPYIVNPLDQQIWTAQVKWRNSIDSLRCDSIDEIESVIDRFTKEVKVPFCAQQISDFIHDLKKVTTRHRDFVCGPSISEERKMRGFSTDELRL